MNNNLIDAVMRGDAARVKELVGSVDINAMGAIKWTYLYYSCVFPKEKSIEIITCLLDAGADPNTRTIIGNTPLMVMTMFSSKMLIEAVRLMLQRGACPEQKDAEGKTVLRLAYEDHRKYILPELSKWTHDDQEVFLYGTEEEKLKRKCGVFEDEPGLFHKTARVLQ